MTGAAEQGHDRQGVHIGSVEGSAFAIGDGNKVSYVRGGTAPGDEAQAALLAAVTGLRADLARFTASPDNAALDAELAAVEGEITTGGSASRGRLTRLREAVDVAGPLVGALASGAAVVESLVALLGG
ncbi:hypothetical protein [Streptomyces sp. SID11385]|uniref:hypothetical protein n=1 Tax=Streptomyces sp. SID11385 TaxID=2706031 RepID=UPI0013C67930|nr:hypothetical protein [Streptomyces sp. SID11385]NEA39051.1 hypothetical protein [Streptomyces sp. SID11385]